MVVSEDLAIFGRPDCAMREIGLMLWQGSRLVGLPLSRMHTANSPRTQNLDCLVMNRASTMLIESPDKKKPFWIVRPVLIDHVAIVLNAVHSAITFCTVGGRTYRQ